MKRILMFSLVGVIGATSANAGWFSDLFAKKDAEPTTLGEACNIDEITAVCPEIILGQKTLVECLTDNVKTVSEKCLNYVKKAVSENSPEIDALKSQIATVAATASETATENATAAGEQIQDKAADVKTQMSDKIDAAKLELAKKLLDSASAK